MAIIIADTFPKQHKRFPEREQGIIANTLLTLQIDPTSPTLNLHKVDRKEGWWSAYVNGDIRIILKRTKEQQMVICWVDHHDSAYLWAKRHTLSRHPSTGAMQLVEIPEVAPPAPVSPPRKAKKPETPPCEKLHLTEQDLLAYGIPELWIGAVLTAKTVDDLLEIADKHLPSDVTDIILKIAVGERPELPETEPPQQPYQSNRERRSWWVVSNDKELETALRSDAWDMWCAYLHPTQRKIAEHSYPAPFRVTGSAGTGKTVVALHHARYLLQQDPHGLVLITTFSTNLVSDINYRVTPLLTPKERERCDLRAFQDFGVEAFNKIFPGHPRILEQDELTDFAKDVIEKDTGERADFITVPFAVNEFIRVVDSRNLTKWEDYKVAIRRGVSKRLSESHRKSLWLLFEKVRLALRQQNLMSSNEMFGKLAEWYRAHSDKPRLYDHIIVDESQDLCEAELEFLAEYAKKTSLFFAGDIGQRIIRYSFPWKPYGIDLRGRSKVLKVNYRTTQQIRSTADRLMNDVMTDADDIEQERKGTVSVLSGPPPFYQSFGSEEAEIEGVAAWLNRLHDDFHIKSNAVAVFVRSENEMKRARLAVSKSVYSNAKSPCQIRTMLEAKGLEYQAVVVMACDSAVIPSPERLAEGGLIVSLEEIYDTERNLLYVACTRARDYLLITAAGTPSEFLLDMGLKEIESDGSNV